MNTQHRINKRANRLRRWHRKLDQAQRDLEVATHANKPDAIAAASTTINFIKKQLNVV